MILEIWEIAGTMAKNKHAKTVLERIAYLKWKNSIFFLNMSRYFLFLALKFNHEDFSVRKETIKERENEITNFFTEILLHSTRWRFGNLNEHALK